MSRDEYAEHLIGYLEGKISLTKQLMSSFPPDTDDYKELNGELTGYKNILRIIFPLQSPEVKLSSGLVD